MEYLRLVCYFATQLSILANGMCSYELFMFYVRCWDEPTQPSQRQKKEAGPFAATQTGLADNFGSVLVAKFGPAS